MLALLAAAASLAACSGRGAGGASSQPPQPSDTPQDNRPDITPETVRERLGYARVRAPNVENEKETVPWRFSRRELQEVNVVDRKFDGDRAQICVDVKTHSVPGAEKPVSSEGRLRLDFELESGLILRQWELRHIENISFKFRREYKEEPKPSAPPKSDEDDESGADAPPPPPATNRPANQPTSNKPSANKPPANK